MTSVHSGPVAYSGGVGNPLCKDWPQPHRLRNLAGVTRPPRSGESVKPWAWRSLCGSRVCGGSDGGQVRFLRLPSGLLSSPRLDPLALRLAQGSPGKRRSAVIFCFLLLLSKMSAFFLSFLSPSCHSGRQIPRGVLCRQGGAGISPWP